VSKDSVRNADERYGRSQECYSGSLKPQGYAADDSKDHSRYAYDQCSGSCATAKVARPIVAHA
jgi:hypothetical protein